MNTSNTVTPRRRAARPVSKKMLQARALLRQDLALYASKVARLAGMSHAAILNDAVCAALLVGRKSGRERGPSPKMLKVHALMAKVPKDAPFHIKEISRQSGITTSGIYADPVCRQFLGDRTTRIKRSRISDRMRQAHALLQQYPEMYAAEVADITGLSPAAISKNQLCRELLQGRPKGTGIRHTIRMEDN